ncbi:fatty acyl-AMP ligase [Nostoc sp.]|uniref:fatty acyl-AMP ligase n=1 Tax=Nostoc sp. TaxID=1180 RepID=UPI002FFB8F09
MENYCIDTHFSTLVDVLRYRAKHQPNTIAFTFLEDGETEEVNWTYQVLDEQAQAIAAQLQTLGMPGHRALLLYPQGLEFIAAFFGCLYAGVIAVPAYPPRANQSMLRLSAIVQDAEAAIALTTTTVLSNIQQQLNQSPQLQNLHWLASDQVFAKSEQPWQEVQFNGDTIAFLQYTSGSTGTPKGVMVSHGNILHNEQMIQVAMQHSKETIFVGWLPLFHDMGLIGNVIQPLYLGIRCVFMSPVAFLQRPWRWLQAISRYQATTSGGPNFAYDLCVRKITDEQRATLDLSSWDVAFSGAEPIRAKTIKRFTDAFEPCGFRATAFYPCYGMAETTLMVSGCSKQTSPVLKTVLANALEQNRVVAVPTKNHETQTLVSSGQAVINQQIVIVNPKTFTRCQPDEVGEIWLSGPNVTQGYWNRKTETQNTFDVYLTDTGKGPFLRTGDLGFLLDSELFVTGRLKDLIIIGGRNHYPQDIELTIEQSHPALRQGCGAAFAVEIDTDERLAVVYEIEREYIRNLNVDEVVTAIRKVVAEQHELQVYGVALLKTGSIPKTTSGKIQRYACRSGFLAGSLNSVAQWHGQRKDGKTLIAQSSSQATQPLSR